MDTRSRHGLVWSVPAIFASSTILNTWIYTQQGYFRLPSGMDFSQHHGDASAAVLGFFVGALAFGAQLFLWHLFLLTYPSRRWHKQIPPLGGLELGESPSLAKTVQAFSLSAFLVVPTAGLVHLFLEVFRTAVVERSSGTPVTGTGVLAHLFTVKPLTFRYKYTLGEAGIQYFPFWESWLIMALLVGAVAAAARVAFRVWAGPKRST
ncbi:MAG: hypothetical protein SX243_01125 [Acidobacteriota bacterium]|nr:hypothetical protein [Acidobacteriota bacterium]